MRRKLAFALGSVLVAVALMSSPAHSLPDYCFSTCQSWYDRCLAGCWGTFPCDFYCQIELSNCYCSCGYCTAV